jgi:signal transduction histidine kinase
LAADVGLFAVLVGLSWLTHRHLFATGINQVDGQHLNVLLWFGAAALASVGMALGRRLLPEAGVALAAVATMLHTHGGWPLLPADLLAVFAVFEVAVRRHTLVAVGSLVAAVAAAYSATGATVAGYRSRLPAPFNGHGGFPAVTALLVLTWFAGAALKQSRDRLARAERERGEHARQAAQQERERIAREIHDIVAHGLSVMIVQAQGAASVLASHPDRSAAALDAIVATGRSSLAEMRRLLDLERTSPDGRPALSPAPGLECLDELVETARGAGLPTTLRVEGPRPALPPDVGVTAYRIVQEALTNAIRHAGAGARALVRVAFDPDSMEVEVTDTGSGSGPEAGGGHGLEGIRQRVALLGGSVETGDLPDGGFHIQARIPLSRRL